MELSSLRKVRGIGPVLYQRIVEGMKINSLTLVQLGSLSAQEVKQKLNIPIHVAKSLVQTPEITHNVDLKKGIDSKRLIPSIGVPMSADYYQVIENTDTLYPTKLKQILGERAPKKLYVWGNLELLKRPSVGFCGSRNVTDKGLDVTRDVSQQIAALNWVTVSGNARGVDTAAHLTALANNSGTIFVLPEGIDGFKLRSEVSKYATPENLLIISEFAPRARWNVGYAMQRNSTIIALSDAMVLVEARAEGGTFSAGKMALKLRHPLFVVKFQGLGASNAGNDYFLNNGGYQLMKSQQTNRANISNLIAVVEERHGKKTEERPKQLAMQL